MGQVMEKISTSTQSRPSPAEPETKLNTPPLLHRTDADEEDDNVRQLQECSSLYLALQDCLVNSDRNWKSCQKEVQALKACNAARKTDTTTITTTRK